MVQNLKGRHLILTEMSVSIALGFVLHSFLTFFRMPYGGSIHIGLTPLLILSFRHNILIGCLSGFISAIIAMLLSISLPPTRELFKIILCLVFDYIFPYLSVGLASVFNKINIDNRLKIVFGVSIVYLLRMISFCISGLLVWYVNTPFGESVIKYVILYNLTYCIPDFIVNLLMCLSLQKICFSINNQDIKWTK